MWPEQQGFRVLTRWFLLGPGGRDERLTVESDYHSILHLQHVVLLQLLSFMSFDYKVSRRHRLADMTAAREQANTSSEVRPCLGFNFGS